MRLRNAFKYSVFEASSLVSTKTPLLKHYYRRQGQGCPSDGDRNFRKISPGIAKRKTMNEVSLSLTLLVIFFSLTEAPLTDPTPTPPNTRETDPKRTRNDPKRSQTEPNGAERSQTEPKWTEIKPFRVGRTGGLTGWGGVGLVREKEYH